MRATVRSSRPSVALKDAGSRSFDPVRLRRAEAPRWRGSTWPRPRPPPRRPRGDRPLRLGARTGKSTRVAAHGSAGQRSSTFETLRINTRARPFRFKSRGWSSMLHVQTRSRAGMSAADHTSVRRVHPRRGMRTRDLGDRRGISQHGSGGGGSTRYRMIATARSRRVVRYDRRTVARTAM